MTRQLTISIPEATLDELEELATHTGHAPDHLAGDLLRGALERARRDGERRTTNALPAPVVHEERPSWLEPRDTGRDRWKCETWAAVVALHDRYPDQLANLEADWWRKPARIKTLGALSAWRTTIDRSGREPRDELAFHTELLSLARLLDRTPGVGGRLFEPDARPPAEWVEQ